MLFYYNLFYGGLILPIIFSFWTLDWDVAASDSEW